MKIKVVFFCLLVFLLGRTCYAGDHMNYLRLKDVPMAKWQDLASKKIFFGHQSVGFNIIAGIQDIMKENPEIQLAIVEGRRFDRAGGEFLHAKVGENRKPESKIDDFVAVIESNSTAPVDIAMLKFCFVDVTRETDIKVLFRRYKQAMADLKQQFPNLTVVHCTIPLRTQSITWKIKIKKLIGKDIWEFADNIRRNEYNRMLLAEYSGREPVFDIARYEAMSTMGSLNSFTYNGQDYLALDKDYSSDGGHLNEIGRRKVAGNLLLGLVNVL